MALVKPKSAAVIVNETSELWFALNVLVLEPAFKVKVPLLTVG
jgi:hypothetical protein